MKSNIKILLALLAFLACQNLLAALDWYPHPYIEKIKSVSSMKGLIVGTYIITNKFPPKGTLYPGITLFTNLISRGAVFAAYNRWDGPEVGSDYDLEYNPAKMRYFYSDEDDATISYKLKNRKFSFCFPEKEWCELDYCLFLDGETYHLYTSPKTARLSCTAAFAEDISPDIPEGEDMNICLSSMQTNNWFIGDPVYPVAVNGTKYKASLALTNGCKVKFSFDAATMAVSHKIVDPCGHYIQPSYYTALGTRELYVNGQEIKQGDSGEGFMFTNDVLVLNGFHGESIDFRGGLTIMSVEGTTNTVESSEAALTGDHGFCNFEGYGRVEFRGKGAIECDDCAMLLEETETFNATDFEEAIVDNALFISAPYELRIDGKDARYHKQGDGWRYDRGTLYLDNFKGGHIECDGYIKIVLAPNSVNVLTNSLECYYGDLTITGAEGASLATPCIDQTYGHAKLIDLDLRIDGDGSSGIDVFEGSFMASGSKIAVLGNGRSNVWGVAVMGGNILAEDCSFSLDHMQNESLSSDQILKLRNCRVNCGGIIEGGAGSLIENCQIVSSNGNSDAICFSASGTITNTSISCSGGLEVSESLKAVHCTLDLDGRDSLLVGDSFDLIASTLNCDGLVSCGAASLVDSCEITSTCEDGAAFSFSVSSLVTNTTLTCQGGIEALENLDMVNCNVTAGKDEKSCSIEVTDNLNVSFSGLDLMGEVSVDGDIRLQTSNLKVKAALSNEAVTVMGDFYADSCDITASGSCDILGSAVLTSGSLALTNRIIDEAFSCLGGVAMNDMNFLASGSLSCNSSTCFISSCLAIRTKDIDAIDCDASILISNCTVSAISKRFNSVSSLGKIDVWNSFVVAEHGTNSYGLATIEQLYIHGGSIDGRLDAYECIIDGDGKTNGDMDAICFILKGGKCQGFARCLEFCIEGGNFTGNVECSSFVQSGGELKTGGLVGLEISESGSFKGGNATIDGTNEAISCPEDIEMADGSQVNLSGYNHIEIEKGLLKKAE